MLPSATHLQGTPDNHGASLTGIKASSEIVTRIDPSNALE